jgi:UDP-N-acetylglucosamine:LPS N-acetylglucosamine transferase
MLKALFLITDAGGGHRGSALALQAACAAQGAPIEARIVNMYQEPWKKAEPLGALTGVYGEDLYNAVLKHSWLFLAGSMRRGARLAAQLPNRKALEHGSAWLKAEKPDVVVSLMPFVNDLNAQICQAAWVPFCVVMTDLVDTRPFMWYTPQACAQAAWVSAPCDAAAAQAREAGARQVLQSGYLLHPKYLDPALRALDRREARLSLGLDPDRLTVLLTMGGVGGDALAELVEGLETQGQDWQVVAICGRNEALRQRLEARRAGRHKVVPVGFTQDLHRYLRAADLCVGKPGPASVLEAVAAATPLVMDAAAAMPQEEPNADWIALHGMGLKVEHRRDLPSAVASLAGSPAARACQSAAQTSYALPDAGRILTQGILGACGRSSAAKAA